MLKEFHQGGFIDMGNEVEEYVFFLGEVISYDSLLGIAEVKIANHNKLLKFDIGAYGSGSPSSPPIVGEQVFIQVRRTMVILQARRF